MKLLKKSLKFSLQALVTTEGAITSRQDALKALGSCNRKGEFEPTRTMDFYFDTRKILGDKREEIGRARILGVNYQSKHPRGGKLDGEIGGLGYYQGTLAATLSFKEYVGLGRPKVITENRSYHVQGK